MRNRTLAVLAFVYMLTLIAPAAFGSDTANRLQMSVKRMQAWIGTDANAEQWRRHLMLNLLETQSAKGDRADIEQLQLIQARFSAAIPGLEHPVFVDVRTSLERHLQQLIAAQSVEVNSYLLTANEKFSPPTVAAIDAYRLEAIYFLELFEARYKRHQPSSTYEPLFAELKLTETLKHLRELDIAGLMPTANPSAESEQARQRKRVDSIRPLVETKQAFTNMSLDHQDMDFGSAQITFDRFVRLLINATDDKLKEFVELKVQAIKDNFAQLGQPGARQASAQIGDALGALDSSLQHGSLVTAIRQKYSMPNAIVEVNTALINEGISKNDSQIRPVDEIILGRQINGQAMTNTHAAIEFLNDSNQITASIHLQGSLHSDTYTKQGPITAFAGSNGVFEGRRNLYANIGGFYATDPYVAANLGAYFKDVNCNLRLVQNVAQKQFARDKDRSQGIAAARTEIKIRDEFAAQTETALGNARQQLAKSGGNIQKSLNAIPSVYAFSQPDRVFAIAHKADSFHIGAAAAPTPGQAKSDISIRVHESMLINFVDPFFVGRKLTNEQIGEYIEKLTGTKSDVFAKSDVEDENWSITFAQVQPFQFEFDDNKLKVGIIGERFSQGQNNIRSGLIIKLQFKITREEGKLFLTRDGKASVEYLDPSDLNARVISFKTFLENKLNQADKGEPKPDENQENAQEKGDAGKIVQQEIESKQIRVELPENLIPTDKVEMLKDAPLAKNLQLVELRMETGWMYLGWKKPAFPGELIPSDLPAIFSVAEGTPQNP